MEIKKCCQNCKYLEFYDYYNAYLCFEMDNEQVTIIDNLNNCCNKYKEK